MIYEMRRYECSPGKLAALHELMENHGVRLFEKHGMTVVGAWVPSVGDDENTLVYLLSYPDMGERQKAWEGFFADPEWHEARAENGRKWDGPRIAKGDSSFLVPTAYSPLQ